MEIFTSTETMVNWSSKETKGNKNDSIGGFLSPGGERSRFIEGEDQIYSTSL